MMPLLELPTMTSTAAIQSMNSARGRCGTVRQRSRPSLEHPADGLAAGVGVGHQQQRLQSVHGQQRVQQQRGLGRGLVRLLHDGMEHDQGDGLVRREARLRRQFPAMVADGRRQAVDAGRSGDMDVLGPLAHADEPLAGALGGREMVVSQLGDGVPHGFVHRARALAAMQVDDGYVEMQGGDGPGQHLAPVAEQQHQVRAETRQGIDRPQ